MTGGRSSGATIGNALRTVFPNGTQGLDGSTVSQISKNDLGEWQAMPGLPYDVFAFCAYLIQITGLMGYFEPDETVPAVFGSNEALKVVLPKARRDACLASGRHWRQKGKPDRHTFDLWQVIHASAHLPIRIKEYQKLHDKAMASPGAVPEAAPSWWSAVFELLIISDETCELVGHNYTPQNDPGATLFDELASARIRESRASETIMHRGHADMVRANSQVSTLAAAADRSVVCVQPKGRVAEIGCTLRNFSRNLSITGPVGSVRCSWQQLAGQPRGKQGDSLDVLLVPLPHELSALSFKAKSENGNWGNFEVSQDWLANRDAISDMVRNLIREAKKDVETINAVIFPEYALTFELFTHLMGVVHDETNGKIEFMIAGASDNCDDEICNCVLTAIWEDQLAEVAEDDHKNRVRLVSQKKHHRWKLDRPQIANYGLASSLRPSIPWWEAHDIEQRELNFFQFRKDAIFASLICEDLARNDPCHEILRSVAPNLVFSLLMDGPQLGSRWPARYASTLADDPGCTVLTFTSAGLVNRSNDNSRYPNSYSVGLLRDTSGTTKELSLSPGKKGVLLTLGSDKVEDVTVDGRPTKNASSWHFISLKEIG